MKPYFWFFLATAFPLSFAVRFWVILFKGGVKNGRLAPVSSCRRIVVARASRYVLSDQSSYLSAICLGQRISLLPG